MIVGFLFPQSFFQYFHEIANLGISADNSWEQRFSFGPGLLLLSAIGLFYQTRRHAMWLLASTVFLIYMLGEWTPIWPVFGYLSEIAHVRYPTRAAIVIYFI